MSAADWEIYARDADLNRVALIDSFMSLDVVPRFNAVGMWSLALEADSREAGYFGFDAGIEVTVDDLPVLAGPVGSLARSWDENTNTLTVSGPDDTVWLTRRLAFPEAPALTTATHAYDARSGLASTVLLGYVNDNAGPSAAAARRVPGLVMMTDTLFGATVKGNGRFQTLQDLLAPLAVAGGDLGYTIVQDGSDLVFTVYEPADRTRSIVFSPDLGNIASFNYQDDAATGNVAIVGDAGQATGRVFTTRTDTASVDRFGRIEVLVDQSDTTDSTTLQQAGDQALAEQADKTTLNLTPADTDAFSYGVDYGLGDRVTVIVDGAAVQDVIREVQIKLATDGAHVVPVVGTPGQTDPRVPALFARFRALERQLHDLQRRR